MSLNSIIQNASRTATRVVAETSSAAQRLTTSATEGAASQGARSAKDIISLSGLDAAASNPAGDLFAVMMEYQKSMNQEARADRQLSRQEPRFELSLKEIKLTLGNDAIDAGMREARERADQAMNAANAGLIAGIASSVASVGAAGAAAAGGAAGVTVGAAAAAGAAAAGGAAGVTVGAGAAAGAAAAAGAVGVTVGAAGAAAAGAAAGAAAAAGSPASDNQLIRWAGRISDQVANGWRSLRA